ncbi:MAG: ABC transporter ATP-binding protein [Planctomyces sp.]|nr:ABC transporter ATP-binding protein [Planctomyces sp.]
MHHHATQPSASPAGARPAGPPSAEAAPPWLDRASVLAATNLHKTYRLRRKPVPVLRGASLTVLRGEFVAIVGASGSGKSTLLHLLGGLDRPDRAPRGQSIRYTPPPPAPVHTPLRPGAAPGPAEPARVELVGRSLNRFRATAVGFIFQFYHLLPELSVRQNVTIAGMVRHGVGWSVHRHAVRARADALLQALGMGHRLDHRPAELSGGERQRVAIARALVNEPPILLADEPTGNLDPDTGDQIMDTLAQHRARSGLTMLVVTHDRAVAARADRVLRLAHGVLLPLTAD